MLEGLCSSSAWGLLPYDCFLSQATEENLWWWPLGRMGASEWKGLWGTFLSYWKCIFLSRWSYMCQPTWWKFTKVFTLDMYTLLYVYFSIYLLKNNCKTLPMTFRFFSIYFSTLELISGQYDLLIEVSVRYILLLFNHRSWDDNILNRRSFDCNAISVFW